MAQLEADQSADDQRDAGQAQQCHGFAEQDDPGDYRADRADPVQTA